MFSAVNAIESGKDEKFEKNFVDVISILLEHRADPNFIREYDVGRKSLKH